MSLDMLERPSSYIQDTIVPKSCGYSPCESVGISSCRRGMTAVNSRRNPAPPKATGFENFTRLRSWEIPFHWRQRALDHASVPHRIDLLNVFVADICACICPASASCNHQCPSDSLVGGLLRHRSSMQKFRLRSLVSENPNNG